LANDIPVARYPCGIHNDGSAVTYDELPSPTMGNFLRFYRHLLQGTNLTTFFCAGNNNAITRAADVRGSHRGGNRIASKTTFPKTQVMRAADFPPIALLTAWTLSDAPGIRCQA